MRASSCLYGRASPGMSARRMCKHVVAGGHAGRLSFVVAMIVHLYGHGGEDGRFLTLLQFILWVITVYLFVFLSVLSHITLPTGLSIFLSALASVASLLPFVSTSLGITKMMETHRFYFCCVMLGWDLEWLDAWGVEGATVLLRSYGVCICLLFPNPCCSIFLSPCILYPRHCGLYALFMESFARELDGRVRVEWGLSLRVDLSYI